MTEPSPTSSAGPLAGRRVMLGVTGGIAAYKAAALASTMVQRGAEVRTVMTEAATRFVTPLTFQSLTRRTVHLDMWMPAEAFQSAHISLADWAEVAVIAPATADALAKFARGLADDLLATAVLALDAPVLLAPAMNSRMWGNRLVQENVARLREHGFRFVGPAEGRLACGTTGPGRMSEPEEIIAALERVIVEDVDGTRTA